MPTGYRVQNRGFRGGGTSFGICGNCRLPGRRPSISVHRQLASFPNSNRRSLLKLRSDEAIHHPQFSRYGPPCRLREYRIGEHDAKVVDDPGRHTAGCFQSHSRAHCSCMFRYEPEDRSLPPESANSFSTLMKIRPGDSSVPRISIAPGIGVKRSGLRQRESRLRPIWPRRLQKYAYNLQGC